MFDHLGRAAGRPWVMLSAGAGKDDFRRILTFAYRAGASGYLAGRAIWWDAFQSFPDLDAQGDVIEREVQQNIEGELPDVPADQGGVQADDAVACAVTQRRRGPRAALMVLRMEFLNR